MAGLVNPIGSDLPLDFQAGLSEIDRKRMLALALRKQMLEPSQAQSVGGMLLPNVQPLVNWGQSQEGKQQLAGLDAQERSMVDRYQTNLRGATSGLLDMYDPMATKADGTPYDNRDLSKAASDAYLAGVPQDLVKTILTQRGGIAMINSMLGNESPFARGGVQGGQASPAAGGPGMPAGTPGGGSMGFLPDPNAPAAAPAPAAARPPSAAPGTPGAGPGPNQAVQPTPFANISDKALFVLSSMPNPMQGVAKEELAARNVKVDSGTAVDWRGNPLWTINRNTGFVTDYRKLDANGRPSVMDPLKVIAAERKGAEAGAEAAAKLPYETVEAPNSAGGKSVVFKSTLPGAPSAAPPAGPSAITPGGGPDLSSMLPRNGQEAGKLGDMLKARGIQANYTQAPDGSFSFAQGHGQPFAPAPAPSGAVAPGGQTPPGIAGEMAGIAQGLPRAAVTVGTSPSLTAEKFAGANAEAQKQRVEAIQAEGAASSENNAQLADIAHHLHNADTSAIAPARQAAAEWLNSMGFGTESPITQFVAGGNLGALQAINKDSVQLAATATKALGSREAAQIFMMLLKANPNIATTPDGLAKIIDFMGGMNQYKMQRLEGMPAWIQSSPTGDIQGYEAAFMRAHPPVSYVGHLQPGARQSPGDQGRGTDVSGGVATPAKRTQGGGGALSPAEQAELDQLRARFRR